MVKNVPYEQRRIKRWSDDRSDRSFYRSNPSFWPWDWQAPRRKVMGADLLAIEARLRQLERSSAERERPSVPIHGANYQQKTVGQDGFVIRRKPRDKVCQSH